MHNWQKGLFKDPEALKSGALYSVKYIGEEEIEFNGVNKVRFRYQLIDSNGDENILSRSFAIKDKSMIRGWIASHTNSDFSDNHMVELKRSVHFVKIGYYEGHPFIQHILPLDGDLYDHT